MVMVIGTVALTSSAWVAALEAELAAQKKKADAMTELLAALREEGVDAIPLKGAVLAAR